MKTLMRNALALAALLLVFVPVLRADNGPRAGLSTSKLNDAESSVSEAATVYRALIKQGKVPASVLKNANCIAVFPQVFSAAIAVGGIHGDGVAFCKENKTSKWSSPVFLNLTGGSLGIQAGVKVADLVLYLNGEKARSAIQNGNFSLEGELSAVAGSFDETFSAPRSGVVAYTSTEGVFAGASVMGVKISHDQDEQRSFYGNYNRDSIFEGNIPPQVAKSVNDLREMLPV